MSLVAWLLGRKVGLGNILNHQSARPCPPLAARASRDEVLDDFQWWSRGEFGPVIDLDLPRHDPRPILGVELITLVDVDPPQFNGCSAGRLETFFALTLRHASIFLTT